MPGIGTVIAQAAGMSLLYAERLLVGVTPQQFARYARPGGVEIKSNHAAFVFGHLATYPPKVLMHIGRPAFALPANFDALFKNGVECVDDPSGTIYPSLDVVKAAFFDGSRAAIAAVAETSDQVLLGANPTEGRMRELFPVLASMLTFYLCAHPQQHLGQVSAWRRMIGLPAA